MSAGGLMSGVMCTYIQTRITRLAAVPAHNWIFSLVSEHRLLEVLWKIVRNDELALHNPLGSCMGSGVTVAVHVPVGLLNGVYLLRNRFDIFFFIGRDVLNTGVKSDIWSVGQGLW